MASKHHIAFVANTSWSIYRFRLALIEKLLEKGFIIYILAPRDKYTGAFTRLAGCTYIELFHLKAKSRNPLQEVLLYRELRRHYRVLQPDLVFHYTVKPNIWGTAAAARTRIPSVSVITGLGYTFSGPSWLQKITKSLYKWQLANSKEVWFLNEDDRRLFADLQLVGAARTFLLPGEGVDTIRFHPTNSTAPENFVNPVTPENFATGKEEIVFLLIGRLIRHKGIYEFAQAAELLLAQGLKIKCQLLGGFDKDNPIAISPLQVREWDDKRILTYLGESDDVTTFIAEADCIVLPSYREGLPLSLLEGASMGKALIATDTAGCRSVVDNGINGYLCREKDAADLADKMKAFYHLPTAAKEKMGLEGRNKILQQYAQEIITGIYLEKIKTL